MAQPEPRITYRPRPDATPNAEANALAAVYAFVLQKLPEHEKRRARQRARSDKPPTARRSS